MTLLGDPEYKSGHVRLIRKAVDAMRTNIRKCAQTVIREETETDMARYKPEFEYKLCFVNKIICKRISMRTRTMDRRSTSDELPEQDQLYEGQEQYMSNMRTTTENDVICAGTKMDSTRCLRLKTSKTTQKINGMLLATSALE